MLRSQVHWPRIAPARQTLDLVRRRRRSDSLVHFDLHAALPALDVMIRNACAQSEQWVQDFSGASQVTY